MGVAHEYRRQEGLLIFPNDSRILLGHFKDESDVDNYLGIEYDGICIEESTQLSSKKHELIGTCLRTSSRPLKGARAFNRVSAHLERTKAAHQWCSEVETVTAVLDANSNPVQGANVVTRGKDRGPCMPNESFPYRVKNQNIRARWPTSRDGIAWRQE
ncbi:MAG TPA: hypothetical protein VKN18_02855 [Blastocatellia bacterium]|nr:hypothetical protein [Blastocatellia bacterium]